MTDHPALPESLDLLRLQLVAAAERQQALPRRYRPAMPVIRMPRSAVAAGLTLALAGSATAAVVAVTSTTGFDSAATPDAPAVAALDGVLGGLRATAGAVGRSPLTGEHGTVRGLTVSSAGISVDVSADDRDICLASRTTDAPTGESGCSPLPVPATAPPFQIGRDGTRTWLVSIVPDGTTGIAISGTDGSRATAVVQDNVAIAVLPRPVDVAALTFRTADGRTVTQRPGEEPQVGP